LLIILLLLAQNVWPFRDSVTTLVNDASQGYLFGGE